MDNPNKILKQGHSFFTAKQYDKAMFLYAQVLSRDPSNKEYQLYPIFCDIATENEDKGQYLLDYFTIALKEDSKTAIKDVSNIISAYDGDNDQMMSILRDFSLQTTESLDAIKYEDFETLIKQRGSFKIAFQDIMFSTKVAITSKNEFYEFVNQLIDNDFKKTAYHYLDGFNEYFKFDKEIIKLYDKLGDKSVEFNIE